MKRKAFYIVLLLGVFFILPDVLHACPNCKEAYMSDGQSPVASGFNTSIVFMMIMPFLVFGGFVLRLWLAQRKLREAEGTTHFNG
ncbi:hypothetical protein KQI65_15110 [bacterium]|nr:hypothetical protein [bacterium]